MATSAEISIATGGASPSFYLMKAEPDSRVVKGKDIKFSVDDFESSITTAWEGVRNYEARNLMQGMKVGDKVLFYHSNTKYPGIAAFAEVSKEAYSDHTAWDETHPYYDAKSNPSSPKWYMVDIRFVSRLTHFVSLALLRHLSTLSDSPVEMPYLLVSDLKAIKNMALLNKGRLSVQRVEKEAWDAVGKIAREGDGNINLKGSNKSKPERRPQPHKEAKHASEDANKGVDTTGRARGEAGEGKGKRRRENNTQNEEGTRRSKRVKK